MAYKTTDISFVKDLVYDLQSASVSALKRKYGVDIITVSSNKPFFKGGYNPHCEKITFIISTEYLKHAKRGVSMPVNNLKRIEADLIRLIVHEDTHKQQHQKYPCLNQNYQKPINSGGDTAIDNVGYFSQSCEAAAYGRGTAAFLKALYPETPRNELVSLFEKGALSTQSIANVYRSSIIPRKYQKKFFRAFYDELYSMPVETSSVKV